MIVLGSKKPQATRQFMEAILEPMSRQNSDGMGYTAIRKNGSMFTERWLNNNMGFKGDPTETEDGKVHQAFGDMVDVKPPSPDEYTLQGDINWSDVTTVMMHTRFATCDKGMANVHPFVDNVNETAIVHNGVIRNHKEFDKLNSTCDSETLLTQYMKLGIGKDPTKIIDLVNNLEGYWAVGATSLDSKGKRVIDIFTSNSQPTSGSLTVAYIKELEGYVLCSSSYTINEAISTLRWSKDYTCYDIVPHIFTRFDASTGEKILSTNYEKSMEILEVKNSKGYGQTKKHSISKKRMQQRGSLSEDKKQDSGSQATTPSGNSTLSNGSGSYGKESSKGMGTLVYGTTGSVASFYNMGMDKADETKSSSSKSNDNTTKLSQSELDALAHWEQSKMDNDPANFVTPHKAHTPSEFQMSLESFIEGYEASDSKYPDDVMATQLSDKELDELDELAEKLDKEEQDILNGLPDDMRYVFLNSLDKEA